MQRRHLLIVLLMLGLTGCGFHLRGSFNLPPNLKTLTIDGKEPYSPLLVHMRDMLNSAGIETPDDAPYTLYITEQELGKERFTQNQNPFYDEFMLTHTATFELRRKDGSLILKPKDMKDMTLFQDDRSTAGTKTNEENILRAELAQKLAAKILRRLTAVKPEQWAEPTSETSDSVGTDQLDGKEPSRDGSKKSSATEPSEKSPDASAP